MSEVKGVLAAKRKDLEGFKLTNGDWYNVEVQVKPVLEKLEKGAKLTLTIEGEGYKKLVTKIVAEAGAVVQPVTEGVTAPVEIKPEVVKELGKPGTVDAPNPTRASDLGKSTKTSGYGSPEDVKGKRLGCAFNVAGSAVAGNYNGASPVVIAEAVCIIAKKVLEAMTGLE